MKKTLKNLLTLLLIVAMMVPLVTPVFALTYPPYTGNSTSLVDGLNNLGMDSSYTYREKIALANGISNYCGPAS